LINLGDWYTQDRDFPRAEACLREAISTARRLGHIEWTSAALSVLTMVLRPQGRLSEAEVCIQEALTLAKEIKRPRLICIALDEIGNLALARDQWESALQAFQEMHQLCPQGDSEVEAMSYYGLSQAYEQLGQSDLALSFGKLSLDLLQQKNQIQHIERVQTWYTSLVQRLSNHVQPSLSVECCGVCGEPLVRASGSGRSRRYCSDRCRKRAHRERETSSTVTK
jgi:tetratricopeptide (TPR) repeat protein